MNFLKSHQRRDRWLALVTLSLLLTASAGRAAPLAPGQTLYDAAFGNGTFVAVGSTGSILSSVGGVAWEPRSSGVTNELKSVAFGGGVFVAAGANGVLVSSADGVNWSVRSISAVLSSPDIAYGNGRFVVGGKGPAGFWTMLVSTNAADWIVVSVEAPGSTFPPVPDGLPFGGVTFGAGKFLAAGGLYGAGLILISTDGVSWKEQGVLGVPANGKPKGPLAYGNGQFAMVVNAYEDDDDDDDGGFYDRLLLSVDGASWSTSSFFYPELKALTVEDCTFVIAPGFSVGLAYYSYGGAYWTGLVAPSPLTINALVHGDGKFLAVGSDIVQLNIPPPPDHFQVSPEIVSLPEGTYLSIQAGAPCLDPPVRYQWRHNDVNVPGATNSYLYFNGATTNDSGQYVAVASTAAGLAATSAVATVTVVPNPPNPPQAPSIGSPSADVTNIFGLGSDVDIYVSAIAVPQPSYQWRFNGTDIPGATNAWLLQFNVTADAAGAYTAVVSNYLGSTTSPVITVVITNLPPYLYPSQVALSTSEGSRVEIPGQYYYTYPGAPSSAYYMFKNGASLGLPLGSAGTLTLREVSLADSGEYSMVASNASGMSTGGVTMLTVTPGGPLNRWTQRNPLPQGDALLDVASGNGRFVGVGTRGAVVTSPDGTNWSSHRLRAEVQLAGVAFGNGLYVAVGEGNILTSTDATTWTTRLTRTDLALQSVAFGNGRFVAAGGDNILLSDDGLVWTDAVAPLTASRTFSDVTFGNGLFVAVGPATIWTSADGLNWQPVSGPVGELESVAYANGQFVAVGNDGVILTSPNGTAWTSRNSTVSSRLLGVAYGNGRYVVVGTRGRLLSSANAVNWTKENSGTPDRLESVAFANGAFVVVGENGTTLSSGNGSTWFKRSRGPTRDLDGLTVGGGLLATVGKNGTIATSAKGSDITERVSGVTNDLHGVAWASGLFVAVGEPGAILTSPDATQWTSRSSGSTSSLKSVVRGGGRWVAVGTQGEILASPDGTIWASRPSPTANDLNGVAYGNGLFVAVGDNLPPNGTLLTSSDGLAWTRRNQYIGKNLRSVTFANNMFLATANDGILLVSTDGVNWEQRFAGLYGNYDNNLRAATFAAGVWMLVGNEGLTLTSPDTLTWTPHRAQVPENLHGVGYIGESFVVIGNRGTILQSGYLARAAQLSGRVTPFGFEVRLTGEVGATYRLQATDQLPAPAWTTLGSYTLVQSVTNLLDPSPNPFRRFYRAVTP